MGDSAVFKVGKILAYDAMSWKRHKPTQLLRPMTTSPRHFHCLSGGASAGGHFCLLAYMVRALDRLGAEFIEPSGDAADVEQSFNPRAPLSR